MALSTYRGERLDLIARASSGLLLHGPRLPPRENHHGEKRDYIEPGGSRAPNSKHPICALFRGMHSLNQLLWTTVCHRRGASKRMRKETPWIWPPGSTDRPSIATRGQNTRAKSTRTTSRGRGGQLPSPSPRRPPWLPERREEGSGGGGLGSTLNGS